MSRTTVVAIAGGTASGKTTLCRALADHLGGRARILLHDRYYRTVPVERAATWNYDEPSALETELMVEHIEALRDGRTVRVPRYDFAAHARLDRWDELQPADVLVVDGILVLADAALRACCDVRIFVDVPADLRLARRIIRDMKERGRRPEHVITRYLDTVRPMHQRWVEPSKAYADHIVDGTGPTESLLDEVIDLLGLG